MIIICKLVLALCLLNSSIISALDFESVQSEASKKLESALSELATVQKEISKNHFTQKKNRRNRRIKKLKKQLTTS